MTDMSKTKKQLIIEMEELRLKISRLEMPDKEHDPAENTLKNQASFLYEGFNELQEGVGIVDENEIIVFCNPTFADIFGKDVNTITGMKLFSLVEPETHSYNHQQVIKRPINKTSRYEFSLKPAQEEQKHIQISTSARHLEDGTFTGAFVVVLDITERLQAEEALYKSEEIYRLLAETARDYILVHNMYGDIIYINDAGKIMAGYNEDEIMRMSIADLVPTEYLPMMEKRYIKRFEEDKDLYLYESEFLTKEEQRIPVEVSSSPIISNEKIIGILIIARNIAERRRLELQLRQSQKMEALGLLAGGIAHDFNNLLTVILSYSEMSILALPDNHPQQKHLRQIFNAGESAANVTRQILAFSRKQIMNPKICQLNEIINNSIRILRRLIGENIEIVVVLDPNLNLIRTDTNQIEQVLFNLILNARDALPDGGKITIETRNVMVDKVDLQSRPEISPGKYILLSISDTGIGIPGEIKEHIFEPFFTTKELGTGLGLSTCYGIVKQNDGYLYFNSELNTGTTFNIYLPIPEECEEYSYRPEEEIVELPSGNETILIVEDNIQVRNLGISILSEHGYEVIGSSNGEEALLELNNHKKGGIHLVFTDIVMPLMGGIELAKKIRKMHPDVKILFTSGFTDQSNFFEDGADNDFLEKPYTQHALLQKVRKILDKQDKG